MLFALPQAIIEISSWFTLSSVLDIAGFLFLCYVLAIPYKHIVVIHCGLCLHSSIGTPFSCGYLLL